MTTSDKTNPAGFEKLAEEYAGELKDGHGIADDFNAAGRELGGPFWHELLDEQRRSIFKTAVRYAARRSAPQPLKGEATWPPYEPHVIFYEDRDEFEFISEDTPTVSHELSPGVTILLRMSDRQPIGFYVARSLIDAARRHAPQPLKVTEGELPATDDDTAGVVERLRKHGEYLSQRESPTVRAMGHDCQVGAALIASQAALLTRIKGGEPRAYWSEYARNAAGRQAIKEPPDA